VVALQMRNVGAANHDFRWHATDVHAGAAYGACCDQSHPGGILDGADGAAKAPDPLPMTTICVSME